MVPHKAQYQFAQANLLINNATTPQDKRAPPRAKNIPRILTLLIDVESNSTIW